MTTIQTNNVDYSDSVIPFRLVGEIGEEQKQPKLTKDGKVKKTKSNKKAGESSEVYPLMEDEINKIVKLFDQRIKAMAQKTPLKEWTEERNKLLFVLGINLGVRASDLRLLKWEFFFSRNNGGWKESYKILPVKTEKHGKYVKLFFNNAVKKAVNDFLEKYPDTITDTADLKKYVFVSPKKDTPITVQSMWNIVTNIAEEAGIEKKIGTHSMRKTFGYHTWRNSNDKDRALIVLQYCFNHSSSLVTQRYIGIMDDDISEMYGNLNLGFSKNELENLQDKTLEFNDSVENYRPVFELEFIDDDVDDIIEIELRTN